MITDANWAKMTPRERDAMVAEALFGVRFWLEQRGEYKLAVTSLRDGREPWASTRNGTNERYTEVSGAEAVAAGFFGEGPKKYASTWPGFGLVVERMRELGWYWTASSCTLPQGCYNARFFRYDKTRASWIDGRVYIPDDPKQATALAAIRALENSK